jgi:hypothetical protein
MKHKLFIFLIYAVVFLFVMSLSACTITGDVYVAFFWTPPNDTPVAGSDFSDIPNAPKNLNELANGAYFLSLPGTFTINYVSFGAHSFMGKTVNLKAASALGGSEDTMYNIFLSDATGVTVTTVP